jgi:hypothetical protein
MTLNAEVHGERSVAISLSKLKQPYLSEIFILKCRILRCDAFYFYKQQVIFSIFF